MKWLIILGVLVLIIVFLGFGWGGTRDVAIDAVGSTSIQPFAEMLAQEFNSQHPDSPVEVQGGGSTAGLMAVGNGIAEIGMCSRMLTTEEAGRFTAVTIARDGLAVVVHPSNPVVSLSLAQVKLLFDGQVTNWRDVGGLDRPVRIISREEGSGTREAFTKMVMSKARISRKALTQESNGSVKELVKHDPCAIGYMSLGLVGDELKALRIDGVPAVEAEVQSGRYPLVRPFLFVTRGPPVPGAQQFIDFVLSPRGQRMLAKEGLVGAR
jgi:phosphate transport system substrate-binding protein